jgi:hypothetical protein
MKPTCTLCWTLANRTPAIDLGASSRAKHAGSFGSLRRSTRFTLFKCSECSTQWKWSLLSGWHHDGQRYAPPGVFGMKLSVPTLIDVAGAMAA